MNTLGRRIVAGDKTAKEEAQTLGRLLAQNGFFYDLMARVQKRVDVLHGEKDEEKLHKYILRWILHFEKIAHCIFIHRKMDSLLVVDRTNTKYYIGL